MWKTDQFADVKSRNALGTEVQIRRAWSSSIPPPTWRISLRPHNSRFILVAATAAVLVRTRDSPDNVFGHAGSEVPSPARFFWLRVHKHENDVTELRCVVLQGNQLVIH